MLCYECSQISAKFSYYQCSAFPVTTNETASRREGVGHVVLLHYYCRRFCTALLPFWIVPAIVHSQSGGFTQVLKLHLDYRYLKFAINRHFEF